MLVIFPSAAGRPADAPARAPGGRSVCRQAPLITSAAGRRRQSAADFSGLSQSYERSAAPRRDRAPAGSAPREIAELFQPGARITLLVRHNLGPHVDADLVMTSDTLPLAIAALQRRHAAESEET